MKILFKKLHPKAVAPKYAHSIDACADLVAAWQEYRASEAGIQYLEYGTGLSVEIPEGFVGLIYPRSSISNKALALLNSVAVIDPGYRGEIRLRFSFFSNDSEHIYQVGDRIGQLMIIPRPQIEFEEVDDLSSSQRDGGGFGSTGE